MARFTRSNRVAAEDAAILNLRRPLSVQGSFNTVSHRDVRDIFLRPTVG